jgi:hypothetical protein
VWGSLKRKNERKKAKNKRVGRSALLLLVVRKLATMSIPLVDKCAARRSRKKRETKAR